MVEHPGKVLNKEDLAALVWDEDYNPLRHDNSIYTTINRLRNMIEENPANPELILNGPDGYYFNDKVSYCMIRRENPLREQLNYRQSWVLDYLVSHPQLTSKDYCGKFKINRTTAVLELSDLVAKQLVVRKGSARSTYYCNT